MTTAEVLLVAGEVLCVALLTGLVTYGMLVLAAGRVLVSFVVLVAGLVFGVAMGVGVVMMELVVR